MMKYPMAFCASADATAEVAATWRVSASEHQATCAIPPEFAGPGGAPSPEDFFLLALANCFVATFKVYAAASKLAFQSIKVEGKLILDKGDNSLVTAKQANLLVHLDGVEQPPRAITLLQKVARSGILLNSVKTELHFQYFLNGQPLE
jgi:organic hydroperoxide reductase OsmC/OhrA